MFSFPFSFFVLFLFLSSTTLLLTLRPPKFSGNKAGYGNDYATGASTLKQGGTDEEKNSRKLRPSEKFDANFQVVDFWGQSLQGFIDMEVVIDVRNSTVLRGEKRKQPSIDGSVSFKNLRWGVQPGEKVHIRFYSDPKTTELSYNVEIQDCSSNEVLYIEEEGKEGKDGETEVIWYCLGK
jgi:hypothetical protein